MRALSRELVATRIDGAHGLDIGCCVFHVWRSRGFVYVEVDVGVVVADSGNWKEEQRKVLTEVRK